jgi:hypothetical protein
MVTFCKSNQQEIKRSHVRKVVWGRNRKQEAKRKRKQMKCRLRGRSKALWWKAEQRRGGLYKEVEAGEVALAVGSWVWAYGLTGARWFGTCTVARLAHAYDAHWTVPWLLNESCMVEPCCILFSNLISWTPHHSPRMRQCYILLLFLSGYAMSTRGYFHSTCG